jgi:rhodanese-related sulfurtransferase
VYNSVEPTLIEERIYMPWIDSLKKLFVPPTKTVEAPAAAAPYVEPEPIVVQEITAAELMREQPGGALVLLDCREPYERRQGYIAGSIHIPMREIPARLNTLDPDTDIVVYCAHGHRSYDVTGWLMGQGYRARSLRGGIAAWQMQNGPITREG